MWILEKMKKNQFLILLGRVIFLLKYEIKNRKIYFLINILLLLALVGCSNPIKAHSSKLMADYLKYNFELKKIKASNEKCKLGEDEWGCLKAPMKRPMAFFKTKEKICMANLSVRSCFDVGYCYARGIGVKKDTVKALSIYKKACDEKDSWACTNLGIAYMKGIGVKEDLSKSFKLLKQGCNYGDSLGCNYLNVLQSYLSLKKTDEEF